MNREQLVVNLAAQVPRNTWYLSDVIPVAATWLAGLSLVAAIYFDYTPQINQINDADRKAQVEHAALAPRVAPIERQLTDLQTIVAQRDNIVMQRKSGFQVAAAVATISNTLQNDAVATHISSRGEVDGVARSYDALEHVWARLGDDYILTTATPTSDGGVQFAIVPSTGLLAPNGPRSTPAATSGTGTSANAPATASMSTHTASTVAAGNPAAAEGTTP